jgi:UDP-glucose 4-epimerase
LSQGHSVHIVDDFSTGRIENIAHLLPDPRLAFDQADIVSWDGLPAAAAATDQIYHLAAVVGVRRVLSDPIQVMTTNIVGTERLLRTVARAERPPRVLLASTSEVYGFNGRPTQSETDELTYKAGNWTRWSYAVTKLASEHFAHAYTRERKLPICTVRFFNMVGPRQRGEYGMVLPNFIRQATRGLPMTVFGDGTQTRSFCDVRDGVSMITQIAAADMSPGEVFNLGHDQEISINDLAALVRRRANSSSVINHVSYADGYSEHFDDIARRRPDLTRLRALIDFAPRWTLAQTIDDLITRERQSIVARPHPSSTSQHAPPTESARDLSHLAAIAGTDTTPRGSRLPVLSAGLAQSRGAKLGGFDD